MNKKKMKKTVETHTHLLQMSCIISNEFNQRAYLIYKSVFFKQISEL